MGDKAALKCEGSVESKQGWVPCRRLATYMWTEYHGDTHMASSIEYLCPRCCFVFWLLCKEMNTHYSCKAMYGNALRQCSEIQIGNTTMPKKTNRKT